MLPFFMQAPLVRALNALLARESWARERLRAHAGKSVRLDLAGFSLALRIASGGSVHLHDDAMPAVKVTVASDRLRLLLSDDPQQRMQAVHIEGEAALAHVVADLARDLRWDVEDDLAQLLGDLPAGMLLGGLRQLHAVFQETGVRLAENATEYATHEAHLLTGQDQLSSFETDLRQLNVDMEACAERIASLQRQLGQQ